MSGDDPMLREASVAYRIVPRACGDGASGRAGPGRAGHGRPDAQRQRATREPDDGASHGVAVAAALGIEPAERNQSVERRLENRDRESAPRLFCGARGTGGCALRPASARSAKPYHFLLSRAPVGSIPLSHDPVAGVMLLSGVGAWPPPDGVG
jgi:hypothetical protein